MPDIVETVATNAFGFVAPTVGISVMDVVILVSTNAPGFVVAATFGVEVDVLTVSTKAPEVVPGTKVVVLVFAVSTNAFGFVAPALMVVVLVLAVSTNAFGFVAPTIGAVVVLVLAVATNALGFVASVNVCSLVVEVGIDVVIVIELRPVEDAVS